jgi:lipopolysaccharide/colanic/teichoic acid biosynthesis glycosyltransferase
MLAIGVTGGGPVLYRQRRVGFRGQEFVILKLRTMGSGPPPSSNGQRIFDKVEGDARVTRVGRILRKFSIDELPQLVNVLRGDMSLVGPRPLLLNDMLHFPRGRPMRRFNMKPGLTGLWQVSGRSLLSDDERIRLDLEYVERWTPWMDIMILLRTPRAVLWTRGAF